MSCQHTPHCPAVATRVDRQGARRSALPLIVLPVERRGRSRTACSRLASGPLCQSNATRVSVPSSALPADRRRVSPVSKHTPTRRCHCLSLSPDASSASRVRCVCTFSTKR
ncbi:hypothetical protein EMIHUDRAFT_437875 [Emiliania huxleyi CCMP1516]|uniref:Uncharacterized protein n=2 Tax=Emiliania huxleyi TaxID=2903 RepID=A0A0D3IGW1_EMIH1|nr:hypothetical protein EMIHUDRAFT_437875 [Emiliania huxleyi CCMP1516]EOD10496.1 hypothetical protein EMIHUDRAFT_437875 [Emiliania huxleyi CCMP1516]|eukprot:XP_005762925.1 hypothetical protein EMIHUDRAFT_437875 [Emiliania huxleyi CCMP1516]